MNSFKCRFCNAYLNQIFVDLGKSPLANSYLTQEMINKTEPFYPLCTFVCNQCLLVQLEEFESAKNIFSDYAYFSSYSDSWLRHASDYVRMVTERFGFNKESEIIEIASNDGYLLQYFKERGIPCIGIEPAVNVAKVAEDKGIHTLKKFFGVKTAKELVDNDIQADLLLGNNVLAHVPNLNDFVAGLKILLKRNGIITMEFPHLLQLINQNQFDTIYHEHFSYFSFIVIQKIFSHHGLTVFDVEEIQTHGGSLRIYARHSEIDTHHVTHNVNDLLEKEKSFGLSKLSTYSEFQKHVNESKKNICNFFTNVKKDGKTIVGYGAPAKGNTLLNYCQIGINHIDYVVDRSPHKQGLYLPGTHLPIESPSKIIETKPDYLIILPWNLKEEIMQQMEMVRKWNGKFVTLIPEVKIYP